MAPPGFTHLPSLLRILLLPPLVAHFSLKLVHLNPWVHVLALLLSYPTWFFCARFFSTVYRRWRANRTGAVLAPAVLMSPWAIIERFTSDFSRLYPGELFQEWADMYGQTYSIQRTEYGLFTTEPIHIKAILSTQFEEFDKGPLLADRFNTLLGSGIFNSDGDTWKFHRSMARPFFSKDRISDFEIFAHHTDETLTKLADRLSQGYPVEFQDLAGRFTLDSATEFLFGQSVDSLGAGLPYPESSGVQNSARFTEHPSNAFLEAFCSGQELTAYRSRLGSFWWLREFWQDKVSGHRKVVNDFVDPILREALARKTAEVGVEKESATFLDHMLENTQDYDFIQAELINILVAGRDTTASTLTFSVHILTQRPDIVKRLREEVLEKVGSTRYPTYQDIRDLKYLRAFINEVLRLYPIVPFNGRTSNRETTLPSATPGGRPIYVPKQTTCTYSVMLLHRRKDLWGPDALEFDPDRFIDARLHKYLTPNPYIFVPFNAGPRICVGQQFAYNEASFFLIRLLQRFESFSLASDAQPESTKPPREWAGTPGPKGKDKIRFVSSLTMMAKGGMWVRMDSAKNVDGDLA